MLRIILIPQYCMFKLKLRKKRSLLQYPKPLCAPLQYVLLFMPKPYYNTKTLCVKETINICTQVRLRVLQRHFNTFTFTTQQ